MLAALLAGCGSSAAHGADAGPAVDASEDGPGDATADVPPDDAGDLDAGPLGPYPSPDAPEYGPDGCALISTPCTTDIMCCQGYCNQGACANMAHPGDRPFH